MEKRLTKILVLLLALSQAFNAYSQSSAAADAALVQGYESYRTGDWNSATFFLRKALTSPSNSSPETCYMLIMSQVYSKNYEGAVSDCNLFMNRYSDSNLVPYVQFQKGKCYFNLGQLDSAVMTLSDFCHQNPKNELYSSALYLIAECFYADYSFDTARLLYENVAVNYPDDPKALEAGYRINTIDQREREQKLLYLLRMTGEEYLSAKENYEKQLKQYQTEDLLDLRRQLNLANKRILELEKAASENLAQPQTVQEQPAEETPIDQYYVLNDQNYTNDELEELRRKAEQIQMLLDYLNAN